MSAPMTPTVMLRGAPPPSLFVGVRASAGKANCKPHAARQPHEGGASGPNPNQLKRLPNPEAWLRNEVRDTNTTQTKFTSQHKREAQSTTNVHNGTASSSSNEISTITQQQQSHTETKGTAKVPCAVSRLRQSSPPGEDYVYLHHPVLSAAQVNIRHGISGEQAKKVNKGDESEASLTPAAATGVEFMVPIDINAFIQDVERSFKNGDETTLDSVWPKVWRQFVRDLPREHLLINGRSYSTPEEVEGALMAIVSVSDFQLIVLLAQQCTMAMPLEMLQRVFGCTSVFIGELAAGDAEASGLDAGGQGGVLVQPERMSIEVIVRRSPIIIENQMRSPGNPQKQSVGSGTQKGGRWWPSWLWGGSGEEPPAAVVGPVQEADQPVKDSVILVVQKILRVFTCNENCIQDTRGVIQLKLECDLHNDTEMTFFWRVVSSYDESGLR